MKKTALLLWICRITAATLMLQTLYFKFSGAEESIYIFSTIGIEPWGRIGTGIAELFAGILILIPKTSVYGALMAMGIMAGAIMSHIFILGIIVKNDGGQLFAYAVIVFLCSVYLIYQQRNQLFNLIRK